MPILITIRKLCKPHDDDDDDDCDDHDDPQPPPTLEDHPFSPLKVLLICTLAVALAFLCYIIVVKTCRAFRTRRRRIANQTETHQDIIHEDHEPVLFHPVWLINTIGLEQSVIDTIEMFKYRKEDGLIESDCPVCLGVFEEDESLRILPKCSHAFHVACIDTWLRSHKNCPVCRAPVVTIHPNLVETSQQDEIPSAASENGTTNTRRIDTIGVRVHSDLTNNCCQKLEQVKRSVSMGSFRFLDQKKLVSMKPKSGKHRGSSSSTHEEGRVDNSTQE